MNPLALLPTVPPLLKRFGYFVALLFVLGVASAYVEHERRGVDDALARADTAATKATAAARRSQKRARVAVVRARRAKATSDAIVDSARRYRARFTPSPTPHTVTYTAPGEAPREIPIAPEIQLRLELDESALSAQGHTVQLDSVAMGTLAATVDSTERARATESDRADAEHRAGRLAWWRGLVAGVKTVVVTTIAVAGAAVIIRR